MTETFTRSDPAGWTVAGEFSRGPHGLTISRMLITTDAPNGVTAASLRSIPVGAIIADHIAKMPVTIRPAAAVARGRRSGRRPLTQELLRDVAMGYIDENAPGSPPGAMKRLAERFGKPEETMRNWVTRARKDGWLGPSVKGRAGAAPGPMLLANTTGTAGAGHD